MERIVYDTRFYPLGQRGIDGANPDADMGFVPIAEYTRFANDHTFIVVQVEDAEAVDCVEEIAAVRVSMSFLSDRRICLKATVFLAS